MDPADGNWGSPFATWKLCGILAFRQSSRDSFWSYLIRYLHGRQSNEHTCTTYCYSANPFISINVVCGCCPAKQRIPNDNDLLWQLAIARVYIFLLWYPTR